MLRKEKATKAHSEKAIDFMVKINVKISKTVIVIQRIIGKGGEAS